MAEEAAAVSEEAFGSRSIRAAPARFSTPVLNKWRQLWDNGQLKNNMFALCLQALNVKNHDFIRLSSLCFCFNLVSFLAQIFLLQAVCVMIAGLGTTGLPLSAHLSIYTASGFDTGGGLLNKMAIVSENIAGSLLPQGLSAEHFQMFESLAPSHQCYLEEGGENLKGRSF